MTDRTLGPVKFSPPPADDIGMNYSPITKRYTLSLLSSPTTAPLVIVSRTCVDCGLVRSAEVGSCSRCHH